MYIHGGSSSPARRRIVASSSEKVIAGTDQAGGAPAHRWAIRCLGRLDRRTPEEVAAARSPASLAYRRSTPARVPAPDMLWHIWPDCPASVVLCPRQQGRTSLGNGLAGLWNWCSFRDSNQDSPAITERAVRSWTARLSGRIQRLPETTGPDKSGALSGPHLELIFFSRFQPRLSG
jgi:hypothetical protein